MKDLRYLNFILTALTIVMALNLAVAWTSGPSWISEARAQGIPDEGAQRNQIIEELRRLNKKADEVREVLVSGKLHVRVSPPRGQD